MLLLYFKGIENGGSGSPERELTFQSRLRQTETSLPVTALRENQGWYKEGLSHDQLVKGFRGYIDHMQAVHADLQGHMPAEKRQPISAAEIIRKKLDWESGSIDPHKGEFYSTLRYAWDTASYERYRPGSAAEHLAGVTLSMYYQHHKAAGEAEPAVIKLPDPVQVRMMDALTEAAEVPYNSGQTKIGIPEKLQHYNRYVLSPEYQERIKAASVASPAESSKPSQHRPLISGSPENPHSHNIEQGGLYADFWNKFVEQASVAPSTEDPVFWPRRVFEKFEYLIASKEHTKDKAQQELAMRLAPIEEGMRKIRIAYEITAYNSIKRKPWEKGKSAWQEMIEDDLQMDRDIRGRDAVELSPTEQNIVRRLCETPRYALDRDGNRTLQPNIPFHPERRVYRYEDIIGPTNASKP